MTKLKTISILGCGWLGFPLAKELMNDGYFVRGATTSADKLKNLESEGIDPYLVHFNPKLFSDRGEDFFKSECLFINIPPGKDRELYPDLISSMMELAVKWQVRRVIFISSTSVYADCCDFVTEESITSSNSVAGDLLRDAENVILSVPSIRSTVIRLAGLIGPGRHPARFFAGRKDIPNGRAPVNLIHLDDCIGIVKAVLRGDFEGEIINACAPDHPSRQEFYTLASKSAGLSLPIFKDELSDWKIVTTNKVDIRLQYQFKVRDLMSWLRRTGTI